MSKEKNIEQMSLLEGSRANHSPLREKDEEQTMIASSGMKLLELYPRQNPNGSLGKMLKALLTSKTAWCSDRSTMIWKAKVSKRKVLLFQLAVKVHGIKENVSGSSGAMRRTFPTLTQDSVLERTKKYSQGGTPLTMAVRQMYPTPNTQDHKTNLGEDLENWKKRAKEKKKQGINLQFALRQAVQMYPTPTTRDYKDSTISNSHQNRNSDSLPIKMMREGKLGGKLNPNFVEFLMGYPQQWTKIEPIELKVSETQSFHKSQEKSD